MRGGCLQRSGVPIQTIIMVPINVIQSWWMVTILTIIISSNGCANDTTPLHYIRGLFTVPKGTIFFYN
ncbi:transmembrane protein, putative [Medicago truncatula]|uniref:Transmembrane protein, putative n=1 Tax=Medicago truncatula TaxID=3880 RepID=G7JTS5_MEDTR|nr:transmembrane protein, putative [Medicago truncatula]